MADPTPRSWSIEFHDSILNAIVREPDQTVIQLRPAVLHASSGRPGLDAGHTYTQDIDLILSNVNAPTTSPFDLWIADSEIHLADQVLQNELPLPCDIRGRVTVVLLLENSEEISLSGEGVRTRAYGNPVYLQEFVP